MALPHRLQRVPRRAPPWRVWPPGSAREIGDPADPRPDVSDAVVRRQGLAEALAQLSPEERATVLLVDGQGFDYRDAGEVLGVPAGTVGSRLNRAHVALRLSLRGSPEGAVAE